jgi:hypothetical protein
LFPDEREAAHDFTVVVTQPVTGDADGDLAAIFGNGHDGPILDGVFQPQFGEQTVHFLLIGVKFGIMPADDLFGAEIIDGDTSRADLLDDALSIHQDVAIDGEVKKLLEKEAQMRKLVEGRVQFTRKEIHLGLVSHGSGDGVSFHSPSSRAPRLRMSEFLGRWPDWRCFTGYLNLLSAGRGKNLRVRAGEKISRIE